MADRVGLLTPTLVACRAVTAVLPRENGESAAVFP
jgi:hypothetical protein